MINMSKERSYAKINIEYDSNLKMQKIAEVEGDPEAISSILEVLVYKLIESGFDRELLEHAILKALKDSEKKTTKIEVQEIHVSKEYEEEFKNLLEKMVKGDNYGSSK